MKLLVTGGAGFIGSHIVKRLISDGDEVTVIDNLCRGSMKNLENLDSKINFFKIDILDYYEMKKIVKKADGIYHQAALASVPDSFKDPDKYFQVNAKGTENILKIAKDNEIRVVFASSSSVYGNQTKFPIKEDAEKCTLNPYGLSKLEAEKIATNYVNEGVQAIGLRYFNVYGIGQNPNYAGVIPRFIEHISNKKPPVIYGDGNQVRNFTYIDDVVEANILAMQSDVKNSFINIATEVTTSIEELAKTMIKMSGLSLEPVFTKPRKGDIKKSIADITLAKGLINWRPQTSLIEGLRKIFLTNLS